MKTDILQEMPAIQKSISTNLPGVKTMALMALAAGYISKKQNFDPKFKYAIVGIPTVVTLFMLLGAFSVGEKLVGDAKN